jgi:hypothetical protein
MTPSSSVIFGVAAGAGVDAGVGVAVWPITAEFRIEIKRSEMPSIAPFKTFILLLGIFLRFVGRFKS